MLKNINILQLKIKYFVYRFRRAKFNLQILKSLNYMGSLKGKEVFMKRRFLIRGSCLVLAIGMILAGMGCEKRKRVPEDMTLGDEYLER